jgi:hypothetical protein
MLRSASAGIAIISYCQFYMHRTSKTILQTVNAELSCCKSSTRSVSLALTSEKRLPSRDADAACRLQMQYAEC